MRAVTALRDERRAFEIRLSETLKPFPAFVRLREYAGILYFIVMPGRKFASSISTCSFQRPKAVVKLKVLGIQKCSWPS